METSANKPTPQESWRSIHETMDHARNELYLAGTSNILLLWGGVMALGYLAQFAFRTLATDLAEEYAWYPAPIWIVMVLIGFVGSSLIGSRAGRNLADGESARRAGIKVFLFFLAVGLAAFIVPGAAGLWNEEAASSIPGVAIGIAALGYVLFGIMVRPFIAVIGVSFAAAYFVPFLLLDSDISEIVTAVAMLAIVIGGAAWLRKKGVE